MPSFIPATGITLHLEGECVNRIGVIHSNKRIGLFLVASPSLGSTYANFVEAIAPIYNVQLDALRFSQENTWLNALDRDFINLKERKRIPIFGKELVEDNFIIARRAFR